MELTRRRVLLGAGGGVLALGSGRAIYNVVLGYDRFTGTNLTIQDLDPLVLQRLRPAGGAILEHGDYRIDHDGWTVVLEERDGGSDGDEAGGGDGDEKGGEESDGKGDEDGDEKGGEELARLDVTEADPATATALDEEYDLPGEPLSTLVADLGELRAERVTLRYDSYPEFFAFLEDATVRPDTVAALRGSRTADSDVVAAFTDADPADPLAVAEGLVEGFREHTSYDVPRYLAGSVEDNVLFGARDLRVHFESPTDFESIKAGENSGLFCYELTRRSVDALQAVPAREQTVPVVGGVVRDARHKHVYTILASVVREDGDLVIPVTFLDYTHSTLYEDLRVRRVVGEGLDAYDSRHRADEIGWYP